MAFSSHKIEVIKMKGIFSPCCEIIFKASEALKQGSLYSESIMSGLNTLSAFTKAILLSTTNFSNWIFTFFNALSTNSVSAVISSRWSIFSWFAIYQNYCFSVYVGFILPRKIKRDLYVSL